MAAHQKTQAGELPQSAGMRPPQQARSQRSLERVLTAGAEILAEQGYDGFTITDVAVHAGVSVGMIYKRFENKAAFFEAILIREQARIVAEENQRLEAAAASATSLADFISTAIRAIADITRREGRLTRVFNERSVAEPELLKHPEAGRPAPRLFARLLLERRAEVRHPDPEQAADMAFWLCDSALDRRVNTPFWRHWDPDADNDWPRFVDSLVYAVQRFLLCASC